jgi:5-formyltetrahydrofolate cyclo-ligase
VTGGDGDLAAAKARARRAAAAVRAEIHAGADRPDREACAQGHLARWLAGQGSQGQGSQAKGSQALGGAALSGYLPIRSEIDPLPVMAAHQGPVGVPVIDGPGMPLRFRVWTPDGVLVPGPFGAQVPETGADLVPQVLIVPLLAWDARGYRLGYGGGFYDRTLAGLRARLRDLGPVIAVGFAFAGQEIAQVPTDGFDQRLDLIATEEGVHAFDPASYG